MKKTFILTALPLVLLTLSCHSPISKPGEKTDSAAQSNPIAQTPQSNNLDQYRQYLSTLDTQKVSSVQLALQRFQQLFRQQPPTICDSAFYLFDDFHVRLSSFFISSLKPDTAHLASGGMRLRMTEGTNEIVRDYPFLKDQFIAYVSPALKEYLTEFAKEDKDGFEEDAGLQITPQKLAERTIWWDQFTRQYPGFMYEKDAQGKRMLYLLTLMKGTDNTPVSEEPGNKLADYYKTAYTYIGTHFPNSETNKIIAPYFTALKAGDTATANNISGKYLFMPQ